MNCKMFSSLLDDWLDGGLSGETAREMQEHADACKQCAALLALRQELKDLDAAEEPSFAFSQSWRNAIRKDVPMRTETSFPKWAKLVSIAAVFAFLVGGAIITSNSLRKNANNASVQEEGYYLRAESASYDMGEMDEAAYETAGMAFSSKNAADTLEEKQEKIIRNVSFSVSTRNFDEDVANVQTKTKELSGRVESVEISGASVRTAWLTLRIPAEKLDAFLSATAEMNIQNYSENISDVTDSYYDTAGRLETQKAKMQRLIELMDQAENVSDLIEIENAVAETQYYIDHYTASLNSIDSRVQYSTVSVTVKEVKVQEDVQSSLGDKITEAVSDSLSAGLSFLESMLVFLLAALPWMIGIAVVIFIFVKIVKNHKKKAAKNNDSSK